MPTEIRSLREIVSEVKDDLKRFAGTRVQLLRQELQEKVRVVKAAAPLLLACALLLTTAYLLLTLALVSLLATWFQPSAYRWFFALGLLGVVWAIFGVAAGLVGWRGLSRNELLPRKTIEVLKADKVWLEDEVQKKNEQRPDTKVGEGSLRAA